MTRAQADRQLYRQAIRCRLERQPNLTLFQQAVDDILIEGDRVTQVAVKTGRELGNVVEVVSGLNEGDRVEFNVEQGQKGLQATNVVRV